ncbi:hypothetical protein AVEN_238806-1, partial [Araneus ventricosus]
AKDNEPTIRDDEHTIRAASVRRKRKYRTSLVRTPDQIDGNYLKLPRLVKLT